MGPQAEAFGGRRTNLNENADGIVAAWTPVPDSPLANLTAEAMSEVAGGCWGAPTLAASGGRLPGSGVVCAVRGCR